MYLTKVESFSNASIKNKKTTESVQRQNMKSLGAKLWCCRKIHLFFREEKYPFLTELLGIFLRQRVGARRSLVECNRESLVSIFRPNTSRYSSCAADEWKSRCQRFYFDSQRVRILATKCHCQTVREFTACDNVPTNSYFIRASDPLWFCSIARVKWSQISQ